MQPEETAKLNFILAKVFTWGFWPSSQMLVIHRAEIRSWCGVNCPLVKRDTKLLSMFWHAQELCEKLSRVNICPVLLKQDRLWKCQMRGIRSAAEHQQAAWSPLHFPLVAVNITHSLLITIKFTFWQVQTNYSNLGNLRLQTWRSFLDEKLNVFKYLQPSPVALDSTSLWYSTAQSLPITSL